jgi:hypothetical protein
MSRKMINLHVAYYAMSALSAGVSIIPLVQWIMGHEHRSLWHSFVFIAFAGVLFLCGRGWAKRGE